jgi:hypothetical protein
MPTKIAPGKSSSEAKGSEAKKSYEINSLSGSHL